MKIGDAECEVWVHGWRYGYCLTVVSRRAPGLAGMPKYYWWVETWTDERLSQSRERVAYTYAGAFRAAMREADRRERRDRRRR